MIFSSCSFKRHLIRNLSAIIFLCCLISTCQSGAAYAFVPTPQKACCLALKQGQVEYSDCPNPPPTTEACAEIIHNMANAAQSHWQAHNQPQSEKSSPSRGEGTPSKDINLLSFIKIIGFLILVSFIFFFLEQYRKQKSSSAQNSHARVFARRMTGFFIFLLSTMNILFFSMMTGFYFVFGLSALYNPESAPTIMIVYTIASIPLCAAVFILLMKKFIRKRISLRHGWGIAVISILALSAIFILELS